MLKWKDLELSDRSGFGMVFSRSGRNKYLNWF